LPECASDLKVTAQVANLVHPKEGERPLRRRWQHLLGSRPEKMDLT
jgi:hypothetical protein